MYTRKIGGHTMTIESLRQRLNAIEAQSTLQRTYNENSNQTTNANADSDRDSYISTIEDSSAIIPSETYGNIMEQTKATKQENGEDPNAPTEEDIASTSRSSNSSGSGEKIEGDSVREYVVGPDGSIYLKITTTDSEGNETVTMTKIADKPKHNSMTPPSMAEEDGPSEQEV